MLEGGENKVREVASGLAVLEAVRQGGVDLVVADMQMGSMGAMAVCLDLRLEESMGAVEHVPVLMLLDRRPDVFLARRANAEGWLVKPLDPLRIRRSAARLLSGGTYHDESYQPVPVQVAVPQAVGMGDSPGGHEPG